MKAPPRCQSTTWKTERRFANDDESPDDWLIDRPVARARDVRYPPDVMPRGRDLALVDLVLGVECLPLPHARCHGLRDDRLQTHWTRILSEGLDANDGDYGNENASNAWKIVGKAALALTAAYVFVYLMVVAVVYLARVPDAASALIPDARSAPAPARSGTSTDRLTVARAS